MISGNCSKSYKSLHLIRRRLSLAPTPSILSVAPVPQLPLRGLTNKLLLSMKPEILDRNELLSTKWQWIIWQPIYHRSNTQWHSPGDQPPSREKNESSNTSNPHRTDWGRRFSRVGVNILPTCWFTATEEYKYPNSWCIARKWTGDQGNGAVGNLNYPTIN